MIVRPRLTELHINKARCVEEVKPSEQDRFCIKGSNCLEFMNKTFKALLTETVLLCVRYSKVRCKSYKK